MKLNLKVRMKNPLFIIQIALAVITPILGYFGLTMQDLTTWEIIGDTLVKAIQNPYVLGLVAVGVYNALTDPTTQGFSDSAKALTYTTPAENCNHKNHE